MHPAACLLRRRHHTLMLVASALTTIHQPHASSSISPEVGSLELSQLIIAKPPSVRQCDSLLASGTDALSYSLIYSLILEPHAAILLSCCDATSYSREAKMIARAAMLMPIHALNRCRDKLMKQLRRHIRRLSQGGTIMLITGSLGIAHTALAVATAPSAPAPLTAATYLPRVENMPALQHHLPFIPPHAPDYGTISGLWGYALRLLGEGLVVEGAMEALIWAIDADCVLMCGSSEQHQLIRAIRLAQYQAIDLLDGKEDGLYNGVLVGFTDEWQERDRSLEQAILSHDPEEAAPSPPARTGSTHP